MSLKLVLVSIALVYFARVLGQETKGDAGGQVTTVDPATLVRPDELRFARKKYRCAMYSHQCFVDFFLKSPIKVKDLVFKSSDDELLMVEWVRPCKYLSNKNINRTCPSKESFFMHTVNDTDDLDVNNINGKIYTAKLEPLVFGKVTIYVLKDLEDDLHDLYETNNETLSVEVIVSQPRRYVDHFLDTYVYIFQTFISLTMGILIDTRSLWKIIKIPIPVIFGICLQYIMMPLIALAYIFIFGMSPLESLALFIYGCSPGGAASNNWTILFEGDIDLSAILTFVSTMVALGMMPAWLYTVGTIFMTQANIRIPFLNMLRNLAITIGPCLLGVILAYFIPKLKGIFAKIAKPITLFVLISFLCLIVYSKWYIFTLFRWKDWVVGPLVPTTGFALSFFLALIFKFPIKQAKTMSIETGIQNVGVAFIIIISTFPSPESDYAILPLISVALMTNVPLYSTYFFYRLYKSRKAAAREAAEKKKPNGAYQLAPIDEEKGLEVNLPERDASIESEIQEKGSHLEFRL